MLLDKKGQVTVALIEDEVKWGRNALSICARTQLLRKSIGVFECPMDYMDGPTNGRWQIANRKSGPDVSGPHSKTLARQDELLQLA